MVFNSLMSAELNGESIWPWTQDELDKQRPEVKKLEPAYIAIYVDVAMPVARPSSSCSRQSVGHLAGDRILLCPCRIQAQERLKWARQ
jgi:hypothetical protein